MAILPRKIKYSNRVVRISLTAAAAVFFTTAEFTAQEKDAPNPENVATTEGAGVTKGGKQKGHGNKGSGAQPEDTHRRSAESDASPPISPRMPDERTVAAQRAIATLNAVIKKSEDSGGDVSKWKASSAELSAHLASRDKSPAQVSAEASAATLQIVEQFPVLSGQPIESGRAQPKAIWLSVGALILSLAALLIVPFSARAAVKKTLRGAGLI